jgi:hypothetical protein
MSTAQILRSTTFIVLTGLAACGGTAPSDPLLSYQEHFAEYTANRDAAVTAEIPGTSLPAAGSVNYQGGMYIFYRDAPAVNSGVGIAGAVNLNVDFDTDTLSGSADDFSTPAGEVYAGSLTVGGTSTAAIDRTAAINTIATTLSGTLINDAGVAYETEATMTGAFYNAADLVVLSGNGTYSTGGADNPMEVLASGHVVP